jgi:predicted MFS family arabinose efflux permease
MPTNGADVFGPALSGALVAWVGPGWVFAADSASFAVSGLFLLAMRARETPPGETLPFVRELAGGLREIAARRWLTVSLVTFAIGNLTIASYFVLGPLIIEEELGGARDWGFVLTGGATGGLVAGLVALRYKPRRPLLVGFALLLVQPVTLVTLIPPLPTLGLAVGAAVGFGTVSIFNVLWETVLQEQVPRQSLSRVSSLDWMVSLVFMPLGFTITGPLADVIGVEETLWLAAAVSVGSILLALAEPGVRSLTRSEAAPLTPSPPPASDSADGSPVPTPPGRLP